jgi:hypothetical protein
VKNFEALRADFRKQRLAFIHTELDAGAAFAQVALTERTSGHDERANRNIALAQQAWDEARQRLDQCEREDDPETYDRAQEKLENLIGILEALRAGA